MYFIHKTKKCLVTENDYSQYGIEDLSDPDLYQVTDLPEDLDLRYVHLRLTDVVFDEETQTALVYPEITERTAEELEQERKAATYHLIQSLIPSIYATPYDKFRFHIGDITEKIYGFMTDMDAWYRTMLDSGDKFTEIHVPVYEFKSDDLNAVTGITMLLISRSELDKVMGEYGAFVVHMSKTIGFELSQCMDAPLDELYRVMDKLGIPKTSSFIPQPGENFTFTPTPGGMVKTVTKN